MDGGALSVLIPGTSMMQLWFAGNWDFLQQVCLVNGVLRSSNSTCHTVHTVGTVYKDIYYSAWADQRRRMRSYMAYTPCSGDRREYIAESGVYISTAREYIAESGVYIFNRKGVYC